MKKQTDNQLRSLKISFLSELDKSEIDKED